MIKPKTKTIENQGSKSLMITNKIQKLRAKDETNKQTRTQTHKRNKTQKHKKHKEQQNSDLLCNRGEADISIHRCGGLKTTTRNNTANYPIAMKQENPSVTGIIRHTTLPPHPPKGCNVRRFSHGAYQQYT